MTWKQKIEQLKPEDSFDSVIIEIDITYPSFKEWARRYKKRTGKLIQYKRLKDNIIMVGLC